MDLPSIIYIIGKIKFFFIYKNWNLLLLFESSIQEILLFSVCIDVVQFGSQVEFCNERNGELEEKNCLLVVLFNKGSFCKKNFACWLTKLFCSFLSCDEFSKVFEILFKGELANCSSPSSREEGIKFWSKFAISESSSFFINILFKWKIL